VEQQKTILANISGAKDPVTGGELSFKDLVTNMVTMLYSAFFLKSNGRVAAADTSAVSLTFALYYIVSVPKVYDRLTSEIRSKYSTINEINGQSTAQLIYLDAVIMEGI
jgi:cytochrome P450